MQKLPILFSTFKSMPLAKYNYGNKFYEIINSKEFLNHLKSDAFLELNKDFYKHSAYLIVSVNFKTLKPYHDTIVNNLAKDLPLTVRCIMSMILYIFYHFFNDKVISFEHWKKVYGQPFLNHDVSDVNNILGQYRLVYHVTFENKISSVKVTKPITLKKIFTQLLLQHIYDARSAYNKEAEKTLYSCPRFMNKLEELIEITATFTPKLKHITELTPNELYELLLSLKSVDYKTSSFVIFYAFAFYYLHLYANISIHNQRLIVKYKKLLNHSKLIELLFDYYDDKYHSFLLYSNLYNIILKQGYVNKKINKRLDQIFTNSLFFKKLDIDHYYYNYRPIRLNWFVPIKDFYNMVKLSKVGLFWFLKIIFLRLHLTGTERDLISDPDDYEWLEKILAYIKPDLSVEELFNQYKQIYNENSDFFKQELPFVESKSYSLIVYPDKILGCHSAIVFYNVHMRDLFKTGMDLMLFSFLLRMPSEVIFYVVNDATWKRINNHFMNNSGRTMLTFSYIATSFLDKFYSRYTDNFDLFLSQWRVIKPHINKFMLIKIIVQLAYDAYYTDSENEWKIFKTLISDYSKSQAKDLYSIVALWKQYNERKRGSFKQFYKYYEQVVALYKDLDIKNAEVNGLTSLIDLLDDKTIPQVIKNLWLNLKCVKQSLIRKEHGL